MAIVLWGFHHKTSFCSLNEAMAGGGRVYGDMERFPRSYVYFFLPLTFS